MSKSPAQHLTHTAFLCLHIFAHILLLLGSPLPTGHAGNLTLLEIYHKCLLLFEIFSKFFSNSSRQIGFLTQNLIQILMTIVVFSFVLLLVFMSVSFGNSFKAKAWSYPLFGSFHSFPVGAFNPSQLCPYAIPAFLCLVLPAPNTHTRPFQGICSLLIQVLCFTSYYPPYT